MSEVLLDSTLDQAKSDRERKIIVNDSETNSSEEANRASTLIEFPGLTRSVPEWRKQLSQRVREVQERRAREAAEAAAMNDSAEAVSCALPSVQLELVPDREQPTMKPIVSKALERLERARQPTAAAGVAPALEAIDELQDREIFPDDEVDERESRKSKLAVVPPVIDDDELDKKPVRLIADGIEDQALSYLDNCLSIPVVDLVPSHRPASLLRRATAGLVDLVFLAAVIALCALAIKSASGDWNDNRVIGLITGIGIVLMFSYVMATIALTGRTLGMRLFSLRTIDKRTGLIPTGGQAIKRAFSYTFSLILFGLGFLYAVVDRDHCTVHDRFSQTIVVDD